MDAQSAAAPGLAVGRLRVGVRGDIGGVVLTAVAAGLLVAAAFAACRSLTAADAGRGRDWLFNSDAMFMGRVYDDLVRDGYPVAGWQFPSAPFWFPDGAIYAAVRAVVGRPAAAQLGYGVAQYLLLAGAAALVAAAAFPGRPWHAAAGALAAAAGGAVLAARGRLGDGQWPLLFGVQYHTGALVAGGYATALLLFALRRPGGRGQLALLAGMVVLLVPAVASDRLLVPWMTLPATAGVWALWALNYRTDTARPTTRTAALATLALLAASVGGTVIYRTCHTGLHHYGMDYYTDARLDRLTAGVKEMVRGVRSQAASGDALTLAAVGALIASVVAVGRAGLWFVRRPHPPAAGAGAFLAVVYLVMAAGTVVAVTSVGMGHQHAWPHAIKYLLPLFVPPLLAAGAAIGSVGRWSAVPLLVIVGVGLVTLPKPAGPRVPVWDYYPPETAALDAVADKYDLKAGFGLFWQAHPAALLSRRGLRVLPVAPDRRSATGFSAYHWLCNKHWYTGRPGEGGPPDPFTFLVLGPDRADGPACVKMVRDRTEAVLGPPAEAVAVGEVVILVYPTGKELAEAMRYDGLFLTATADFGDGTPLVYPGRALQKEVGDDTPTGDRRGVGGRTRPGALVYGPHVRVPAGRYRVTLTHSAAGAAGSDWYVFTRKPHAPAAETKLHYGTLPDGDRVSAAADVDIPADDTRTLEVRLWYNGVGTVTVHALAIQRLD